MTTIRLEELKKRREQISFELIEASTQETSELEVELVEVQEELKLVENHVDVKSNEYNFTLDFGRHTPPSEFRSFSRLLGKDIILAFSKKKHLLGWEKKYCKFIIGVDKKTMRKIDKMPAKMP